MCQTDVSVVYLNHDRVTNNVSLVFLNKVIVSERLNRQ